MCEARLGKVRPRSPRIDIFELQERAWVSALRGSPVTASLLRATDKLAAQ
jgi:hypothetical protein